MARNKYDISEACAKRVALRIREKQATSHASVRFDDIVELLRQEHVYSPERGIEELLTALGDADEWKWTVVAIGRACAWEARAAREVIRNARSGIFGLIDHLGSPYVEKEEI